MLFPVTEDITDESLAHLEKPHPCVAYTEAVLNLVEREKPDILIGHSLYDISSACLIE
jgi:hypothetical protein